MTKSRSTTDILKDLQKSISNKRGISILQMEELRDELIRLNLERQTFQNLYEAGEKTITTLMNERAKLKQKFVSHRMQDIYNQVTKGE